MRVGHFKGVNMRRTYSGSNTLGCSPFDGNSGDVGHPLGACEGWGGTFVIIKVHCPNDAVGEGGERGGGRRVGLEAKGQTKITQFGHRIGGMIGGGEEEHITGRHITVQVGMGFHVGQTTCHIPLTKDDVRM